jgi:hypothetical protein
LGWLLGVPQLSYGLYKCLIFHWQTKSVDSPIAQSPGVWRFWAR